MVNDLFIENDEIFSIEISLPVGTTGAVLGPTNTGIGRIPENDGKCCYCFCFYECANVIISEKVPNTVHNYCIKIAPYVPDKPGHKFANISTHYLYLWCNTSLWLAYS